ncbi:MAG: pyridoxal phosphate-dependent aminotransferase [Nitrososphaerales archaeon]
MDKWFESKLMEIGKLNCYIKPVKSKGLKLDANENLVLKKDFIKKIAIKAIQKEDLRKYPLQQLDNFYLQLSKYTKIDKKNLAIGNGSDQIIDLILSAFGKEKRVTTFTPTFSYFIDRCQLYSMKIDKIPLLQDNSIDKKKFIQSAKKSEIIYICSPNNPTGNQFDKELLIDIFKNLDDKLIILDEAYIDFANYSFFSETVKSQNIIILRTLSKAFGLAGARLGYCIANENFSSIFKNIIQYPYAINNISLNIGNEILKNSTYIEKTIKIIKKERKRILDYLNKTNNDELKVFQTDSNFIFFQVSDINKYERILTQLKKDKISVKAIGMIKDREGGHIRVTIGTKRMNNKFLSSLSKVT